MELKYGPYPEDKLSITYQVIEKVVFQERAYHIGRNTLTPAMIKALNDYADANDHKAIPGRRLFRGDNREQAFEGIDYRMIHMNKKEAEELTGDFINQLADTAVQQFGCDITNVLPLRIITYNEGNFFDWHPDDKFVSEVPAGLNTDFDIRKITCITPLTDPEIYEGGVFELATPDRLTNADLQWRGKLGFTLMFPAFVQHRVRPITKGQRRSLVTWFCGPQWK